jgi:hypothetical protein
MDQKVRYKKHRNPEIVLGFFIYKKKRTQTSNGKNFQ